MMMSTRLRDCLAAGLIVAAATAGSAAATAATPVPHLRSGPIVTFDRSHPTKGLRAYVRFTKTPPRTSKGAALVRIGLSSPAFVPVTQVAAVGHKGRACYSAQIFGGPAHPKTGAAVKIVLETGARSAPTRRTITVHLRGVNKEPTRQASDTALRDLGCVG